MKKVITIVSSFLLTLSVFAVPMLVSAQVSGDPLGTNQLESTGLGNQDPRETAANIIRIVLSVLGVVAIVIVLYGGILWMTAAGNDDQVGKAKKVLFSGVIGLVIILSAYALTQFVINQLLEATGSQF